MQKIIKKGQLGESILNILLWVIFFILAGAAVWFVVKNLTG